MELTPERLDILARSDSGRGGRRVESDPADDAEFTLLYQVAVIGRAVQRVAQGPPPKNQRARDPISTQPRSSTMKTLLTTLTLSLAGLLAVPAVMAADAAAGGAAAPGSNACKADAEKLCPGVQPGEGRIKACFKQHKDQLSPECKNEISQAAKKRKGA
jgi:hypothetical protein